MMDNQHRMIAGYRELTKEEIELMNEIKMTAEVVGRLVQRVERSLPTGHTEAAEAFRWAQIGKTDLQKGFMSLTRAVARPTTF